MQETSCIWTKCCWNALVLDMLHLSKIQSLIHTESSKATVPLLCIPWAFFCIGTPWWDPTDAWWIWSGLPGWASWWPRKKKQVDPSRHEYKFLTCHILNIRNIHGPCSTAKQWMNSLLLQNRNMHVTSRMGCWARPHDASAKSHDVFAFTHANKCFRMCQADINSPTSILYACPAYSRNVFCRFLARAFAEPLASAVLALS